MSATVRRLAITGATGYIGTALARRALAAGWSVRALSRRRPVNGRIEHVPYSLEAPVAGRALEGVEALVHLAADTSAGSAPQVAVEFAAARTLLDAARRAGTRVVFVSSQTARADAPSDYGRSKWRIEQDVLAAGGSVVRPGQAYGGAERGLFGFLCRLLRLSPVQPDLRPSPMVQPIHVDDLTEGLLRIAGGGVASGCYCLAAPEAVSFTEFLRVIASRRLRRPTFFIPVPFTLVLHLLALGRRLFGPALDPDRLRSLNDLPQMESAADLAALGLTLRPLTAGMHPSGDDRRRRLLIEARVLLGYLLRERPPSTLCRRYVRSVERLQGGEPLALPEWLRRWPGGLALLDGPHFRRPEVAGRLEWRLEAATLLAESSPIGARRFLLINGWRGPLPALLRILRALAGEGVVRLARLPLGFWLRAQRTRVQEETR